MSVFATIITKFCLKNFYNKLKLLFKITSKLNKNKLKKFLRPKNGPTLDKYNLNNFFFAQNNVITVQFLIMSY